VKDQYDKVAVAFDSWLASIEAGSIPQDIVAINLGLFETAEGYKAYILGSRHYDPNDDSWACTEEFVPTLKYFPLGSTFSGRVWTEVVSEYRRLLEPYLENHPGSQLHRLSAITVGFDDGDLTRVQ
jgi:hypothetical protein